MTSPTSKAVYLSEVRGEMETRQSNLVHDHLPADPIYALDSLDLMAVTGMKREAVTRSLNNLYEGRHPGLFVDYIVKPSAKSGRMTKHFYRIAEARREPKLSELLEAEGWVKDGKEMSLDGWRIRKIYDGCFHVSHSDKSGEFRGDLNTKNYRVILDAVMGGGR